MSNTQSKHGSASKHSFKAKLMPVLQFLLKFFLNGTFPVVSKITSRWSLILSWSFQMNRTSTVGPIVNSCANFGYHKTFCKACLQHLGSGECQCWANASWCQASMWRGWLAGDPTVPARDKACGHGGDGKSDKSGSVCKIAGADWRRSTVRPLLLRWREQIFPSPETAATVLIGCSGRPLVTSNLGFSCGFPTESQKMEESKSFLIYKCSCQNLQTFQLSHSSSHLSLQILLLQSWSPLLLLSWMPVKCWSPHSGHCSQFLVSTYFWPSYA